MIQNTGDDWKGFNTGLVAPAMNHGTIAGLGSTAQITPMTKPANLVLMYKKVKSPGFGDGKCVGFRVFHGLIGEKKSDLTGGYVYHDKVYKTNKFSHSKADTCAETHMYKSIKGELTDKSYLVVTQDCAPCRQCIASYAGLAKAKKMAVMVYFEEGYDILPDAPGLLVFTETGAAYHFG